MQANDHPIGNHAEPVLVINRRAEDDLMNLRSDKSDDSSFINIILIAIYGRQRLLTHNANLKPLQDQIKKSDQYHSIRGILNNSYVIHIIILLESVTKKERTFASISEKFFDRIDNDVQCGDAGRVVRRQSFDYLVRSKINNLNKRRASRPRKPRRPHAAEPNDNGDIGDDDGVAN